MRPLHDCIKKDKKEETNIKCEFCNLGSGDYKFIKTDNFLNLRIEKHSNAYTIIADDIDNEVEVDINYCPMCR